MATKALTQMQNAPIEMFLQQRLATADKSTLKQLDFTILRFDWSSENQF